VSAPRKRCVVAFATAARQYLWPLELPASATIAEALAAARAANDAGEAARVPWETAPVGVFGEVRARSQVFADGDRIELYRELPDDPRERRRAQVARARRARG
jgi:putative ubiquitin-RnfH superfamily antitoxin RatB of RatAB toxin-antitoxin module